MSGRWRVRGREGMEGGGERGEGRVGRESEEKD